MKKSYIDFAVNFLKVYYATATHLYELKSSRNISICPKTPENCADHPITFISDIRHSSYNDVYLIFCNSFKCLVLNSTNFSNLTEFSFGNTKNGKK